MVDAAASVEWIVTRTEVAALMTEYHLSRSTSPVSTSVCGTTRASRISPSPDRGVAPGNGHAGEARKGTQYFGPYAHAYAIRQTLDLLLRTFPIRTCTNAKMKRHAAQAVRACCSTSKRAGPLCR